MSERDDARPAGAPGPGLDQRAPRAVVPPARAHPGSGVAGALLLACAHVAAWLVLSLLPLPEAEVTFFATLGVSQLVYGLPIALWLRRRGRSATLRGVLLMMGLTFLSNAACWGLVLVDPPVA